MGISVIARACVADFKDAVAAHINDDCTLDLISAKGEVVCTMPVNEWSFWENTPDYEARQTSGNLSMREDQMHPAFRGHNMTYSEDFIKYARRASVQS